MLYHNGIVVEYDYKNTTLEALPIKLFNNSYGYIYEDDLRFLNLKLKFKQKRLKFHDNHILLSNSLPPFFTEGHDSSANLLFGPGIQMMSHYWIAGISQVNQIDGYIEYPKDTFLWSEVKRKWISGPMLPYGIGIEEGCLTLLNRTSVMVIGVTKLKKVQSKLFLSFTVHQPFPINLIFICMHLEFDKWIWAKRPTDKIGYFGEDGAEPNNLVYIYDFDKKAWNNFMTLPTLKINRYTCTTHISKIGKRYKKTTI